MKSTNGASKIRTQYQLLAPKYIAWFFGTAKDIPFPLTALTMHYNCLRSVWLLDNQAFFFGRQNSGLWSKEMESNFKNKSWWLSNCIYEFHGCCKLKYKTRMCKYLIYFLFLPPDHKISCWHRFCALLHLLKLSIDLTLLFPTDRCISSTFLSKHPILYLNHL